MADRIVDLNDFWRGNIDLANLTAQLLTDREQAEDSVFAGDTYGSEMSSLLRAANAEVLVPAELERVIAATGVDAEVAKVEHERAIVRTLEAEVWLTPASASIEES